MDLISVISTTNQSNVNKLKLNSNYLDAAEKYINLLNFYFNQYCATLYFRHLDYGKEIKERMIFLIQYLTLTELSFIAGRFYESLETILRICRIAVTSRGSQPALTSK